MILTGDAAMDGTRRGSMEWLDGGTEAAPLEIPAPPREPATESAPDPSWRTF